MQQSVNDNQAMMAAAQGWADGLHTVINLIGSRFPRAEPRQRVAAYVRGLLSPLERKNGWQLAEQAENETPCGIQHLLGRAVWSADEVRDDLRTYVVHHFGDARAVLVVDETGFLKKGTKSVGVARQYSGTAGRIENCQIGVFLVYATEHGRTFLDRELYLPKAWAVDGARRAAANVPETVSFATKLQLARRMITRTVEAKVPFGWITGDSVYGNDWRMRTWLEEQGLNYVLGVTAQYRLFTGQEREWAATVVRRLPTAAWHRGSCGAGRKGERLYDWTRLPLRAVDGRRQRWLLARRSISAPTDIAYYVASGPQQTPLDELARVVGVRWTVEESFETAKGEVGLDQYEVRSWQGWYRHITLALLAHAYLTVLGHQARAMSADAEKKSQASTSRKRQRYSP
jgi:SRSO17 transposase